MSKVFTAKYSGGTCSECGDPILRGDEVSYAVDLLVHAECNDVYWTDPELEGWRDEDATNPSTL